MAVNRVSRGAVESLAHVARLQGLDTSADAIRRRFAIEHDELDAAGLMGLASELGMRARPLRMGWDDLPRLAKVLPALLLLKDGSVAVLEAVVEDEKVGRVAVISDPAAGPDVRTVVDRHQMAHGWGGD